MQDAWRGVLSAVWASVDTLGAVATNDVQIERRIVADVPVEIRRSRRRRRSIHAFRDGDVVVLQVPAALDDAELDQWVARMVERVTAKEKRGRSRTPQSDEALAAQAAQLSARYLDGSAVPASIRWVTNQNARWGSCTPSTRTIRISHRLQSMPDWVVDYVILHELAHLLESGHGPRFWALANRHPKSERAQGFLEGVANAAEITDGWPQIDDSEVPESDLDSGSVC